MEFPITPGRGDLPKLILVAPDGARAEIYLHGAQVTSWIPAGAADGRLFLSARSRFSAESAIRGGIPVSFPQFAAQGPLPNHGFARESTWQLVHADVRDDGAAAALLRLADSHATRQVWPHPFTLELALRLSGRSLHVALRVVNTGGAEFSFTAALHTYLRIRDVQATAVHGLQGATYFDKVSGRHGCIESASALDIIGPVDRVYHVAPPDLEVREPDRAMAIRATGFPDTVVWNPGAAGALTMADLGPGTEREMLCIEAAAAAAPVALAPGASWQGTQMLTAR
jgi:glucose-6-phosphate 1-epimerase